MLLLVIAPIWLQILMTSPAPVIIMLPVLTMMLIPMTPLTAQTWTKRWSATTPTKIQVVKTFTRATSDNISSCTSSNYSSSGCSDDEEDNLYHDSLANLIANENLDDDGENQNENWSDDDDNNGGGDDDRASQGRQYS